MFERAYDILELLLGLHRSTLITFSYPLLFTSLMLNQKFREQHALAIADMLHRSVKV